MQGMKTNSKANVASYLSLIAIGSSIISMLITYGAVWCGLLS